MAKKKSQSDMVVELDIPEGVTLNIAGNTLTVKGKEGEIKKDLVSKRVNIESKDNKVIIKAKNATKREKTMIGTFKSHINNMIKSSSEGSVYKLKVCSGHFPMNVSVDKGEIVIKNFLGEKIPRKLKLKEGADVKVDGDLITVKSANKEIAGQVAASIEQLTRRTKYDIRIFMDGIWITEKDGKEIK